MLQNRLLIIIKADGRIRGGGRCNSWDMQVSVNVELGPSRGANRLKLCMVLVCSSTATIFLFENPTHPEWMF